VPWPTHQPFFSTVAAPLGHHVARCAAVTALSPQFESNAAWTSVLLLCRCALPDAPSATCCFRVLEQPRRTPHRPSQPSNLLPHPSPPASTTFARGRVERVPPTNVPSSDARNHLSELYSRTTSSPPPGPHMSSSAARAHDRLCSVPA
jgi:hypothetical protein